MLVTSLSPLLFAQEIMHCGTMLWSGQSLEDQQKVQKDLSHQ